MVLDLLFYDVDWKSNFFSSCALAGVALKSSQYQPAISALSYITRNTASHDLITCWAFCRTALHFLVKYTVITTHW
jgi:hypothetical protein